MANITLRAVKGSALTFQEADDNINNLNSAKLESVSEDTAPSLGGDLDVGSNAIVTTDESGVIQLTGIINVTGLPLLGEGSSIGAITSSADSDLFLAINDGDITKPAIFIDNTNDRILMLASAGDPVITIEDTEITFDRPIFGTTGLQFSSPNNSTIAFTTGSLGTVSIQSIVYPNADGTAGQVLTTNGSGVLSFTSLPAAGIASVSADTTPSLGGNLDLGSNAIVTTDTNNPFIQLGGPTVIQGAPLASPLTEDLFSAITASANSTLVLTVNNADFTKPGIAINDFGIGFYSAIGSFDFEMFFSSNSLELAVPITSFEDTDLDIVGIGTGNIQINSIVYPKTDGTAGQSLVTNGSGVLSFADRVASSDVLNIVKITQAAYDALNPPVATTLYLIEE